MRHLPLFTVLVLLSVSPAAVTAAEPKTVSDFFLLVPDQYVPYYDLEFRKGIVEGKRRGTIIDIKNGFMSWDASDNSEYFEFAIFRKRDGSYVAAYSVPADTQFGSDSVFHLLAYEKGKWREVTRELLPVPPQKSWSYGLPRQGREIKVWEGDAESTFGFVWANDRFHLTK